MAKKFFIELKGAMILYQLLLLFLLSCSGTQKPQSSLPIIDLENAFEKKQEVQLSTIVDSITYIPLEMVNNSIIPEGALFEVTKDFILARCTGFGIASQILLFEKNTGKFIREIGKRGRGPNEYEFPTIDFYNIYNNEIYTTGYSRGQIKTFKINGDLLSTFRLPEWPDSTVFGGSRLPIFHTYLNRDTFVIYVENISGIEKKKIILFNKEGIIKEFGNFLTWKKINNVTPHYGSFLKFYRWDMKLYFKENFNDTLFQVTKNALIPRLIFYSGKYSIPYEMQDFFLSGKLSSRFFIDNLTESSKYLFFTISFQRIRYTGIYDKNKRETLICSENKVTETGIIDDVNGFISIIPRKITTLNEMISVLDAPSIIKWIHNNPLEAKKLEKKLVWLKDLTELSNPIIVIAKCKD